MRIFVTGTGRCGTVTFSKACSHIENFSSGHETYSTKLFELDKSLITDNRIEVDPHFSQFLPLITKLYPDARWVHLIREKEPCVKSLSKTTGLGYYIKFASMSKSENDREVVANVFYDMVNDNIAKWIKDMDYRIMHLERLHEEWSGFWNWIGAKGNLNDSLAELSIKHNSSKKKYGK